MSSPKNVLLLHGFTGSPFDMAPLSKELMRHGMKVEVGTLAGHGTKVEDLLQVRSQDWINAAEKSLASLPMGPKVIVALSMGCFLATYLAANEKNDVSGLVFLAPAFVLKPFGRLGIILSKLGIHRLTPFLKKTNGPDICDQEARRASMAYDRIPLRSLIEFEELRKSTLSLLPKITCPVFVGVGAHDHTVDNEAVAKVLENLGTKHVERHTYANSAHIVPLDFDREKVYADVVRFIESIS